MKEPDGVKKVLLIDHIEGQCRCIIGFKDGDARAAYMCGEPVYQRRGKTLSSWCAYHYRQMHTTAAQQNSVSVQSPEIPQAISIVRNP
ncbi:hypothetical protein HZZ13_14170 [Bradyrhizobium sp. CNPSo 4010]|uniref:GcrA cell cycle regulator n=1 Tax=Bradyrhizobium agreste TaxID=2751811 RepID=A0ABS0PP02_9BRAD|nr:hypothetical protein [Bradyrhizobium agreste]MBH5398924.1 hypothetical protein [Bradyrhizobium agreste]